MVKHVVMFKFAENAEGRSGIENAKIAKQMLEDVDRYTTVQEVDVPKLVQARTHKKKRINKKWRKRYGVREVPWKKFYIDGNKIYCHPKMIEKIKADIYMR